MQDRKRVAIIGSGCTGIATLWALRSTSHEIHLYEAAERLGGHTNTVVFKNGEERINVDTGFIVMNTATYPNFIAFLKELGIRPVPTEMTFSVSRDKGLFEWAGTSLSSLFAQRKNIVQPRMWRMIFDIIRFNQYALDLLHREAESEEDPVVHNESPSGAHHSQSQSQQSIGDYLDQENYSEEFRNNYLIPMTAAVWSTSPDKASLEFPAITLVRFLWNHHLLSTIAARPTWMTIKHGSKQYIDAVMKDFPQDQVHLNTPVKSVRTRTDGQIVLLQRDGKVDIYDHVILATHGDNAMEIIRMTATAEEKEILSNFKTSSNTASLHSDLSLMPTRSLAWASWNYITTTPTPNSRPTVCLTYNMNILQHIPSATYGDVLVTLNPIHAPRPELTQGTWTYRHPLYTAAAIRSQTRLPHIQNTRGISYAGAWTKYGFHEDGFSSGLRVAVDHLGARLPFDFVDSTFSRGRRPVLGYADWAVRAFVQVVLALLWILSLVRALMRGGTRAVGLGKGEKME
ncbi:hypothetical protein MMC07_004651 [Pseudocyphellaria aurata]|nr:hypothetical protein [Pseudocyphellaria aurata]